MAVRRATLSLPNVDCKGVCFGAYSPHVTQQGGERTPTGVSGIFDTVKPERPCLEYWERALLIATGNTG